ncbi:TadE/TadG family type IV pilus assembly protein [Caldimonas tepidiphila]|uniref:TadE/TadG family type IV pilus assembly protein n=1 Tax=Caldimonas tepidiphila TaxID=2315841 RepID=UPI000E5C20AC|nr:TadE family protein [Caldimonas tepidiphila]
MKPFQRGCRSPSRQIQQGHEAVEFALVSSLVFFPLLLGAIEFGRLMHYWNTAAEVTRLGARMAVVCDLNDAEIKSRMRGMLPLLNADDIRISYYMEGGASSCTNAEDCETVTVELNPSNSIPTIHWLLPRSLSLPAFKTTLPRESMQSELGGVLNPVCN